MMFSNRNFNDANNSQIPNQLTVYIPEYNFDNITNPFAFDAEPQRPLSTIALRIYDELTTLAGDSAALVRGVQSGLHTRLLSKVELIDEIIKNGSDASDDSIGEASVIYAAPFEGKVTVEDILSGFHEYKPKCEERPQYPVDIWMVYDSSAYENIEYLHPRHGVMARDKWRRKVADASGLLGIVCVETVAP